MLPASLWGASAREIVDAIALQRRSRSVGQTTRAHLATPHAHLACPSVGARVQPADRSRVHVGSSRVHVSTHLDSDRQGTSTGLAARS